MDRIKLLDIARRLRAGGSIASDSVDRFFLNGHLEIPDAVGIIGDHWYGDGFRVGRLELVASKEAFDIIAGALAMQIFSADTAFFLRFSNKASEIAGLLLDRLAGEEFENGSVAVSASQIEYHRTTSLKRPWRSGMSGQDGRLPCIQIVPPERASDPPYSAHMRGVSGSIATGFGGLSAAARLLFLLLDFSDADNTNDEVDLEGPAGFGDVAANSWELRLWLPGSVMWPKSSF